MPPRMSDTEVELLERVEAELQAVREESAKLRTENLELKRVKRQLEKHLSKAALCHTY